MASQRELRVFWELTSVRFIVGGVIVFGVYNFLEPFVSLWLGERYILDHWILVLLMVNVFIMQTRGAVDMFNGAFGHYSDVWAAWVEGILNVAVTLISAPYLGICGILLGKIVSLLIIVVIWKPIYLFRDGFKLPLSYFWKNILRYYVCFALAFALGVWVCGALPLKADLNFGIWLTKVCVLTAAFVICYMILLYSATKGTRHLLGRLLRRIKE